MSTWTQWMRNPGTGKWPFEEWIRYEVKYRNGRTGPVSGDAQPHPAHLRWTVEGTPADIIWYRYEIKGGDKKPIQENTARSKYHKEIKPGVWVDVYEVLTAFEVTNPADAHGIKKMLMPGKRGEKDAIKDREEAIQSLQRAIELEGH